MPTITLRRITNNDHHLLLAIYASTREAELSLSDWSLEQKDTFIKMQFEAQYQHYTSRYNDDDFSIISYDQQPAGRIFSAELDNEIRIVDIALLPNYQRLGIGSFLIKQLFQRALRRQKNITLHVNTPMARWLGTKNSALNPWQVTAYIH